MRAFAEYKANGELLTETGVFRIPCAGEWYLSKYKIAGTRVPIFSRGEEGKVRHILRIVELPVAVKGRRHTPRVHEYWRTPRELEETGEVRPPKCGELYVSASDGSVHRASVGGEASDGAAREERIILKAVKPTPVTYPVTLYLDGIKVGNDWQRVFSPWLTPAPGVEVGPETRARNAEAALKAEKKRTSGVQRRLDHVEHMRDLHRDALVGQLDRNRELASKVSVVEGERDAALRRAADLEAVPTNVRRWSEVAERYGATLSSWHYDVYAGHELTIRPHGRIGS